LDVVKFYYNNRLLCKEKVQKSWKIKKMSENLKKGRQMAASTAEHVTSSAAAAQLHDELRKLPIPLEIGVAALP
jgi:tRNA A-37 threonylcarbamoyl transferase component Bud32